MISDAGRWSTTCILHPPPRPTKTPFVVPLVSVRQPVPFGTCSVAVTEAASHGAWSSATPPLVVKDTSGYEWDRIESRPVNSMMLNSPHEPSGPPGAWRGPVSMPQPRSEEHTSELQSRRDLVC